MKKRIISLVLSIAILIGIAPITLPTFTSNAMNVIVKDHTIDTSKLKQPTKIKFWKNGKNSASVDKTMNISSTSEIYTYEKDGKLLASYADGVLALNSYDGGPIYIDGDIVILLKGENAISSSPNAGYQNNPDYLIYATGNMYIVISDDINCNNLYLNCGENDYDIGQTSPYGSNGVSCLRAEENIYIYDSYINFDLYYTKIAVKDDSSGQKCAANTVHDTLAKSTIIENSKIISGGGAYKISDSKYYMSRGDLYNVSIINSTVKSDAGIFGFSEIINSTVELEGDIYGFGTIKDSTVKAMMVRQFAPENIVQDRMAILYKYCAKERADEQLIIDNSKVYLKGDNKRFDLMYGIKDEYGDITLKDGTKPATPCSEPFLIVKNKSYLSITDIREGIVSNYRGVEIVDSEVYIKAEDKYGDPSIGIAINKDCSGYGTKYQTYGLHVSGKSTVTVNTVNTLEYLDLGGIPFENNAQVQDNVFDLSNTTFTNYYIKFVANTPKGSRAESTLDEWNITATLGETTRITTRASETGGSYSDGVLTPAKELDGDNYKYTIFLRCFPLLKGSASLTGTVYSRLDRTTSAYVGKELGVNTDSLVRVVGSDEKPIGTFEYQWQYLDTTTKEWIDISKQTYSTYKPTDDMIGKTIRCVVTATYHEGQVATSPALVRKVGKPTATTLWGDANGDGKVNSADIILIKKYIANFDGTTSSVEVFPGADANGDGSINSLDVILLKKYIANIGPDGNSSVVLGPST